ncbi:hypothetical protein VSR01_07345 [Actinacidiphila sp. DG2A-62]|jgi:hypothetical protein|uniref:hypothetical protein n=1 Tax=Actinacidiphila sp. DG2A-62 TaxID=3108821 RepID=UPI002DBE2454|nr:hypothetical protein [Actinacidiphila sp. DG2A-62]MEC3993368.1 hypothetical protein [Actinacidiphila sp. DG2A-62]
MTIDWHALASVAAAALISTVALVGIFTLGVVGLSPTASTPLRRGAAYLCFAACAAAVAYGIHLIVAK